MKTSRTIIKNRIYKEVKPYTSKLYSDMYWKGVDDIRNSIAEVMDSLNFKGELIISNGVYRKNGDSLWKQYDVEIHNENEIIIAGILYCGAAGYTDDPFSHYDVTLCIDLV